MAKTRLWVLVADGTRARILASEGRKSGLKPVPAGEFSTPVPPGREIASDRPGRSFESADGSRHAMAPPTDWRQFEKEKFAREVADILNAAAARQEYDRLILVAPAKTLGALRKALDKPAQARVVAEIDKDLTHESDTALAEHIERISPV